MTVLPDFSVKSASIISGEAVVELCNVQQSINLLATLLDNANDVGGELESGKIEALSFMLRTLSIALEKNVYDGIYFLDKKRVEDLIRKEQEAERGKEAI